MQRMQCTSLLRLSELDLSDNSMDNEGINALGDVLANSTAIRTLNLSANRFVQGIGWKIFIRRLQSASLPLKAFRLGDNRINDEGLSEIGNMMRNSKTLKTLDLSYNASISTTGWHSFFILLCSNINSVLESLCLQGNKLEMRERRLWQVGWPATQQSSLWTFHITVT